MAENISRDIERTRITAASAKSAVDCNSLPCDSSRSATGGPNALFGRSHDASDITDEFLRTITYPVCSQEQPEPPEALNKAKGWTFYVEKKKKRAHSAKMWSSMKRKSTPAYVVSPKISPPPIFFGKQQRLLTIYWPSALGREEETSGIAREERTRSDFFFATVQKANYSTAPRRKIESTPPPLSMQKGCEGERERKTLRNA